MFRLLLPTLLVFTHGMAMDNLKVAYQWKTLDFVYPTETERQQDIRSKKLFHENNLPTGIEVYEDRLFLAIPRLKKGVVASLAYINITVADMNSPKLHPYPNWEAHRLDDDNPPKIVSPFKIRADRCGRLWVLDTGIVDIFQDTAKELVKPQLLIYDLRTDQLIRNYTIPQNVHQNQTGFVNIAVEDDDCQNSFAYLAEIFGPGLVVYSYQSQKSWLVKHHYFNINPLAGRMTVAGKEFTVDEGIFGLALSKADDEGYSTLYFHPFTSFDEFSVSTKVLRNETLATSMADNFHMFKRLGTRGEKGESGASFLDKKSNVIFFALVHLNAVICWRITNTNYTTDSHSRVFWSNETMVYPSDIKVDANSTLWVLSNKFPVFVHDSFDSNEYNFRILNAKVSEAIKDTACDSKMVVNKTIVNKIKNIFNKDKASASSSDSSRVYVLSLLFVLFSFVMLR